MLTTRSDHRRINRVRRHPNRHSEYHRSSPALDLRDTTHDVLCRIFYVVIEIEQRLRDYVKGSCLFCAQREVWAGIVAVDSVRSVKCGLGSAAVAGGC